MRNVLIIAVLTLFSSVLFAQTTQPTTRPGAEKVKEVKEEMPTMQTPDKPAMEKPAATETEKPSMKMPEKPKMEKPAATETEKPSMKMPEKPKMEKPAKPAKPKMPKMPKMDMSKLPGANILKSAGIDDLAKSLKDMGIGKKEADDISTKNMDMLKTVGNLVSGGKVNWKNALKEVKGLNKTNLKDIKGMLTKDQMKKYKPVAKKIWTAVKDFVLKALKK